VRLAAAKEFAAPIRCRRKESLRSAVQTTNKKALWRAWNAPSTTWTRIWSGGNSRCFHITAGWTAALRRGRLPGVGAQVPLLVEQRSVRFTNMRTRFAGAFRWCAEIKLRVTRVAEEGSLTTAFLLGENCLLGVLKTFSWMKSWDLQPPDEMINENQATTNVIFSMRLRRTFRSQSFTLIVGGQNELCAEMVACT
jgi:hypothetical protein